MTNQQLTETCRDILAEADKHESRYVEMAKALLPCLEAEPVAWVCKDNHGGKSHIELNKQVADLFSVFCGHEVEPIYTVPPAPEMKLIELPQMISSWEGDDAINGRNKGIADCVEALRKQGYEVAP